MEKLSKCKEKKQKIRRKTLNSLCSTSALLLSVVCCIALIHVEIKIQEHHRLISHSVTFCDQMETEILRKVQQNHERWQAVKASDLEDHLQDTKGENAVYFYILKIYLIVSDCSRFYASRSCLH